MASILFYCISFFFPVSPIVLLYLFKKREKTLSQKILFTVFLLQTFLWLFVIIESTKSEVKDIFIVIFTVIFLNAIFYFLSTLLEKNDRKNENKKQVSKEEYGLDSSMTSFKNDNKIKKIKKKKFFLSILGIILFLGVISFFKNNDTEEKIESSVALDNYEKKQDTDIAMLDIAKLEEKLLNNNFLKKEEADPDGYTLLSFQKKIDKYEQIIAIDIMKNNIEGFSIISSHFHLQPNQKKIKENLDEMTMIVRDCILVEKLKNQMTYMNNHIPVEPPKVKPGYVDDWQKITKVLQVNRYRITTNNYERTKEVNVEIRN